MQSLLQRLENGGVLSLSGICASARPFLAALIQRLRPGLPIVVVTESRKTQESFHQDLETWMSMGGPSPAAAGEPASPPPLLQQGRDTPPAQGKDLSEAASFTPLFYPAWEVLPHEDRLPHADVVSERLETLVALLALPCQEAAGPGSPLGGAPGWGTGPPDRRLVVASVEALLQLTFSPQALRQSTRTLTRHDRLNPLDLIEWLEDQGYEPEVRVAKKGELSLRGGIVDVYPLTSPWPVRLEFVGDELESLRHFDPVSQLSRDEIPSVTLPPAGEFSLLRNQARRPRESGAGFRASTLLDYLPRNALFLLCEPDLLAEHAASYAEEVPASDPLFTSWESFQQQAAARGMTLLALEEMEQQTDDGLRVASLEAFRPLGGRAPDPQVTEAQRREFFAQVHRWLRLGHAVHVFCNNTGERDRFVEIWAEYGLSEPSRDQPASGLPTNPVATDTLNGLPVIRLGTLSQGFLFEEGGLVVVTDAEIFGRYRLQRARRLKSPHALALRSSLDIDFAELEEGDYVVHLEHGIGRYQGLRPMPGGAGQEGSGGEECLVVEYAPRDPTQPPPRLYVPVTEAHLISKYVGAGKARPPLNTLGGSRWARTKAQAERAVRDLAGELLSIQAARASQAGHAFQADTSWQREFESAFIFEETPDQARAITQTKADMEEPKPMDRLICGDVGFGKTEVAIRAAFKAVMDGLQVAVLVPTTVLAQQHFNTFRERMADYPVRIELLSRFRTRRAQQQVVAGLASGAVDIVIGTHRLVQRDIVFKNLGLVVIDEEQRFGVRHKEKFKQLRRLVDVLTLSATPIPRTLYLALTGARDMSTIQTPPHDRLPVETIVTPYDERVIRDAILRELGRGGQVFFLHNRVLTIQAIADRLRALVPDARLVVGHGQMDSDELEEVMTRFVNGEADVLLSTTIIESGLDIPNANTIIIDRADRFGLSDLYQLRGRVGRYKHQAYAYLLIPRHARLLTDARKRISALKQYSTLGSGFKIAMRDLEIRGAGNLLGPEQSGHITAVGFDLYCQLLKRSVARLKGDPLPALIHVRLDLDFLALTPLEEAKGAADSKRQARKNVASDLEINVPRETWSYADAEDYSPDDPEPAEPVPVRRASAAVPVSYVSDPGQRIEIYRKLAQCVSQAELDSLARELRDRFGPVPPPVELLLLASGLKLLAAARNITNIATKEGKLMLTRNNDYVTVDGKFPRLTKTQPKARLNEIRRLLTAL